MTTLKFLATDRLFFVISPRHETNMTHTEHPTLVATGIFRKTVFFSAQWF